MFTGHFYTMRLSKIIKPLLSVVAMAAALESHTLLAQAPPGPPSGMNAVMGRLLRNSAFTAKAELRVLDRSQKETTLMPMNYAMLDGKTRFELDMTQVKSTDIPAAATAFMKQMNMDQVIVIMRPDQKLTFVAYPKMQAYVENPMNKEEQAEAQKDYKIDKTKLGNEKIDGHACTKNTVALTDEKGQKQTAIVWNAADLNDFPVQLQLADAENTIMVRFKDVKLARPDAKDFEPPTGMAKYDASQMLKKLSSMSDQQK
jgi:Domain of unknown function (DUF4412)